MHTFRLIGASWCPACSDAKQWLAARGIDYIWHDIDVDPWAKAAAPTSIPTLRRETSDGRLVGAVEGFYPDRWEKLLSARPLDGLHAFGGALGDVNVSLGSPVWGAISLVSSAVSAYHGYKRNQSVGWAIWWALMGGIFPIITPVIALAQGYGKRAR